MRSIPRVSPEALLFVTVGDRKRRARDLEAEGAAHRKQLRRLARRTATDELIEGMMDGSYLKYIEGR